MPDVLDVPCGPGDHRPHRDYEDTRAYCADCYELWPCRAHRDQAASHVFDRLDASEAGRLSAPNPFAELEG